MYDDKKVPVKIGDKDYNLILTTAAEKEISKKYGGIAEFGKKIFQTQDFDLALDEITELVVILANQDIMLRNLDAAKKEPLLTAERVELTCSPVELVAFREPIIEAFSRGLQRNVESEEEVGDSKNAEVG